MFLRHSIVAGIVLVAGCRAGVPAPVVPDRSSLAPHVAGTAPLPDRGPSPVQPVAYVQVAEPPQRLDVHDRDDSRPLTLDDLQQLALQHHPAIAEARARVQAACGYWMQVGLPPNPSLGYLGQQLFSGGEAEQQGLYVQQELVRGGKLGLNRQIAAQEVQKAEQQLAAQQQRVMTDVRLAYYDVLIAQRRSETGQELAEFASEAVGTAEALLQAKEVSQVDVMRARGELQRARLFMKNAGNRYTAAWSQLVAVLGVRDLAPRPIQGDLEQEIPRIDMVEAMQRLLDESPVMAAALTEVDRAQWAVQRAYAEPIPNVDVQAVVQHDNGTGAANANLQVALPIPLWNRNQGSIRQAESQRIAAEQSVARVERSLQHRLAGVYQRYASARQQVEDYSSEGGILENSKTTLEFVRKGYQAGEVAYLDLLAAQQTNSQTNLDYIESLGQLWAAAIEIDGLLLRGSLDTPALPTAADELR